MIENIDMFEKSLSKINTGYFIAQCTDKLIIDKLEEEYYWDVNYMFNRAFDIRIFNCNSEVHLFRSSIDKDFEERFIVSDQNAIEFSAANYDSIIEGENTLVYYDEEQFLNIDTTRIDTAEQKVHAVGGGEYKLPIKEYMDAKIIIRNYIDFEENTGRAYVNDWRIVGFVEGK